MGLRLAHGLVSRVRGALWTAALPLLLSSCTPLGHMQRLCNQCHAITLATPLGPIFTWTRPNPIPAQNSLLHIYLENDGAAYIAPNQIAANPSLRANFLALRLMQLDPNPSVYLTRPCYGFAFNALPPTCHAGYWTNARYSQTVVSALTDAIEQVKSKLRQSDAKIVLIGHSGGGSLALLIAQQRSDVQAVVTLAGNLDPDAWARWHGYTPLDQSLNPFYQPLLTKSVRRWHFAGGDDRVIPPHLMLASCKQDTQAHCQIVPGVEHSAGWLAQWPQLLRHITPSSVAR